jgi:hypothetical protein
MKDGIAENPILILPFKNLKSDGTAVKVINHYGSEEWKVFEV